MVNFRRALERRWSDDGTPIRGVLAVDYETDGLDPASGHAPFLAGCEDERGRVRIWEVGGPYEWSGRRHPLLCDGPPDAVRDAVENPAVTKVSHNAKFEMRMSRALGWRPGGEWLDTMQMAPLADEYQRLGLRWQSERHLGVAHPEEDEIKGWIRRQDAERRKAARARIRAADWTLDARAVSELLEADPPPPTTYKDFYLASDHNKRVMIDYLEKDLDDCLRLRWLYEPEMRRLYAEPWRTETRLVRHVAQMEDDGIRIDVGYCEERVRHFEPELLRMEDELEGMCGAGFNPNSPVQVAAQLADRRIRVPSTRAEHLEKWRDKDEFVDLLLKYRQVAKIVGTFFKNLLEMSRGGVIHASFWQNGEDEGIKTGRFSSSRPNLQNVPTRTELGKMVRRAFIPRDGFELYAIDYKQIEPRLLAHYAREYHGGQELIEEFLTGVDPYIAIGTILFGSVEEAVRRRFEAKTITLALMYGMGIDKMARKLGVDAFEARGLKGLYFQRIPCVKALMHSCQVELARKGYVEDDYGRRYRVPRSLSYKAINAKIQGTAAGVMKRAMVRVGDECERSLRTLGVRVLIQVHDELLIEAPRGFAGMRAAARCAELMEDRQTFELPLEVDVEVGCPSWADKRPFALWERRSERLSEARNGGL